MASIDTFKGAFQQGGARPNQFEIQVGRLGQQFSILCFAANLPAYLIGDIPVYFRGRPVHVSGEKELQTWQVGVYNDYDFPTRNALEKWSHEMINREQTNGILPPRSYYEEITVKQLDRNDRVVKTYKMIDAYPSQISQIDLGYQINNTVETYQVTFIFNHFVVA